MRVLSELFLIGCIYPTEFIFTLYVLLYAESAFSFLPYFLLCLMIFRWLFADPFQDPRGPQVDNRWCKYSFFFQKFFIHNDFTIIILLNAYLLIIFIDNLWYCKNWVKYVFFFIEVLFSLLSLRFHKGLLVCCPGERWRRLQFVLKLFINPWFHSNFLRWWIMDLSCILNITDVLV